MSVTRDALAKALDLAGIPTGLEVPLNAIEYDRVRRVQATNILAVLSGGDTVQTMKDALTDIVGLLDGGQHTGESTLNYHYRSEAAARAKAALEATK